MVWLKNNSAKDNVCRQMHDPPEVVYFLFLTTEKVVLVCRCKWQLFIERILVDTCEFHAYLTNMFPRS